MLAVAFLITSVILFILASAGVAHPRVSLGWLGLAFFSCAFVLQHFKLGG